MIRKFAFSGLTALALTLASCGSGGGDVPVSGEPLEKVAAPAGQSWTQVVSQTEGGGYKMGNPEAALKLVEYGAITCPGCAQFHVQSKDELHEMVESGVVSMEFRPFLVHGIQDVPGFLLAKCNGPEAFFGLTDQLFSKQNSWLGKISLLSDAERQSVGSMKPAEVIKFLAKTMDLVNFVKPLGVSEDAANLCLADTKAFETLVAQSEKFQKEDKVGGTPSFRLNGADMNAGNWNTVKASLKNAGARK